MKFKNMATSILFAMMATSSMSYANNVATFDDFNLDVEAACGCNRRPTRCISERSRVCHREFDKIELLKLRKIASSAAADFQGIVTLLDRISSYTGQAVDPDPTTNLAVASNTLANDEGIDALITKLVASLRKAGAPAPVLVAIASQINDVVDSYIAYQQTVALFRATADPIYGLSPQAILKAQLIAAATSLGDTFDGLLDRTDFGPGGAEFAGLLADLALAENGVLTSVLLNADPLVPASQPPAALRIFGLIQFLIGSTSKAV